MALNHVTLDDKYDLTKSRIFVTGFQAIVRLCLMQKERDRRAGLNTAGFVTGYRGSPLGTLDLQFIRAQRALDKYDVRFQGGVNEDIAATAPRILAQCSTTACSPRACSHAAPSSRQCRARAGRDPRRALQPAARVTVRRRRPHNVSGLERLCRWMPTPIAVRRRPSRIDRPC